MEESLRLYKEERLCGLTTIDRLFSPEAKTSGHTVSVMAYPWRAVWSVNPRRQGKPARMLISVPKKRARHAVDRVKLRRRCREAYRLSRHLFDARNCGVDMAFIFVGKKMADYATTLASVNKILSRLNTSLNHEEAK